MDISDNHIVKQVRQGDIESYSELVQRYQRPIFNLMYRVSQSKEDAARDGLRLYSENLDRENSSLPSETIEKRQEVNKMFMALSKLPHEKQEMLLLRYKQELSIGELGEIFNLSSSAVKMRIHRSLAFLQKQLNGELDVNERN